MNATMDLTARAISFITAIQTTLLKGAITLGKEKQEISILTIDPLQLKPTLERFIVLEKDILSGEFKKSTDNSFSQKAIELVWISRKNAEVAEAVPYTMSIASALAGWIWENKKNGIAKMQTDYGNYPTPFNWREVISRILYKCPGQRVALATTLQYLPIEIILALGGGNLTARTQRILQMWKVDHEDQKKLLNAHEMKSLSKFASLEMDEGIDAATLLEDNDKLSHFLRKNKVPFSFEHILNAELQEIQKNRTRRTAEQDTAGEHSQLPANEISKTPQYNDADAPYENVSNMGLYALTFSGGGIRSSTFNLGILQGLARENVIAQVDYLSTVSGGGYIGSWLAAWIKRDGSVVKVTNRLCPDKSPDPLGEELRPVKWLRMYSNYFNPNASIMSADSWTVGITWLRNTLLNQVIIFLMLLSALFTGSMLYHLWKDNIRGTISSSWQLVLEGSIALLIPVALLAGFGMHAYHSESVRWVRVRKEHTKAISNCILIIGFLGAYLLSGWLSGWGSWNVSISQKTTTLLPAAGITFASLTIVAILGKYVDCIKKFKIGPLKAWMILLATGAIATIVGLLCLVSVWEILQHIAPRLNKDTPPEDEFQMHFIVGVPLTIEVFCITVVARMALLGKYFPDERREWWGRLGGYVHRISFLWLLITSSALLGQELLSFLFEQWWAGVATGGWIALVGSTVRAAFSASTSGKDKKTGTLYTLLNLLGQVGPYLFAFGLLVFLPVLIKPLLGLVAKPFSYLHLPVPEDGYLDLLTVILSLLTAYLLARQVGVNEFSMHHFYRNRLIRAFLGATRRSTDRQQTSNPFTGFDALDDERLFKMKNEFGYYGPYLVMNAALNASQVVDLDRQDRKAESFVFSPLFCGFDFSMLKASADVKSKSYDYAYRETKDYAYKDDGPTIGTAMAVSGAAINPNQGYHSSAATAFLLTVFNLQMGRWIGNPRKSTWQSPDPHFGLGYILNNLIGKTDTRNDYVALSDGGHFDNMGLYEMVRRRCRYIIVCDAEQDTDFTCEGFANAIRRCRIDFGAEIYIDISKVINRTEGRFSAAHYALGKINYPGDKTPSGDLLYIKSSIIKPSATDQQSVDVYEYAVKNTAFPHQTTADQFFDEEQFESYRKLGMHIAGKVLADKAVIEAFHLKVKVKPAEEKINGAVLSVRNFLKKLLKV